LNPFDPVGGLLEESVKEFYGIRRMDALVQPASERPTVIENRSRWLIQGMDTIGDGDLRHDPGIANRVAIHWGDDRIQ